MANEEHLAILKQGVEIWNRWRKENPEISPDLADTICDLADLRHIDLRRANLHRSNFTNAKLNGANLSWARLTDADFSEAILIGADLQWTSMSATDLTMADLSGVRLFEASLWNTNLTSANLNKAKLMWSKFHGAICDYADLSATICGRTLFAAMDLSTVKGLDTVRHDGPSSISIDTLILSKGKIPEIFLRGCGVPEDLITFLPSFFNKAIQFYSCFISYSHADAEFARRLHDRLQGEGIRCWLDEHQLNPGDQLHPTIYEAIRLYDKVLLCCSETSLKSWWVDKEFGNAIRKEEDYKENVLIPLNLDGYLFTPPAESYLTNEIKKRLAADFTAWKDHDGFEKAFKSIVKALRTDGGKLPPPEPKLKPKR